MIGGFVAAALACLSAGEVGFSPGVRSGPHAAFLDSQHILAHGNSEETHFAPGLTPGVPDEPELSLFGLVVAPTGDAHCVVQFAAGRNVVENASLVGHQGFCVQIDDNGTSLVDFCLHLVDPLDSAVLSHSHVGILVDGHTLAPRCREGTTSSADVDGFAGKVLTTTATVAFLTVL